MFKRLNRWIKRTIRNYLEIQQDRDLLFEQGRLLKRVYEDHIKRIEALEKNIILRRKQTAKMPYKKKGDKLTTTIKQNPNKVIKLNDDSPLKMV